MRPVVLGNAPQPSGGDPFARWVLAALKEIERASSDTLVNDPSSSGTAIATLAGGTNNQFPYLTSGTVAALAGVGLVLGGYATAVNLNSANTDSTIAITSPTTNYAIDRIVIKNRGTTASINTASAGVFSATGAGGTAVAANQALAALTTNTVNTAGGLLSMTLSAAGSSWLNFATLYFRVGTAQGAAATADVYVYIRVMP